MLVDFYQPSDWLRMLNVLYQSRYITLQIVSEFTYNVSSDTLKLKPLSTVATVMTMSNGSHRYKQTVNIDLYVCV